MKADKTTSMTVRRMPFAYNPESALHWNPDRPEFSQIVNAASLAMPYLEPYLIKTMREARPLISDDKLVGELDLYCAQESTHYLKHRKFNEALKTLRPTEVEALEATLAADYSRLGSSRSLRFNLAYAEGFESMALAIGHMLIEDRKFLFGGAETGVTSLVLWHFVEEIEHKNVTFDVFKHLYGSHFWRMTGLIYATIHIMGRTRSGYRTLLKADGLWHNLRSRIALARVLVRIFASLIPKFLRVAVPSYHPNKVDDPSWMRAWAALYEDDATAGARLDTTRLHEARPFALAA